MLIFVYLLFFSQKQKLIECNILCTCTTYLTSNQYNVKAQCIMNYYILNNYVVIVFKGLGEYHRNFQLLFFVKTN